jgi:hypothetical protein
MFAESSCLITSFVISVVILLLGLLGFGWMLLLGGAKTMFLPMLTWIENSSTALIEFLNSAPTENNSTALIGFLLILSLLILAIALQGSSLSQVIIVAIVCVPPLGYILWGAVRWLGSTMISQYGKTINSVTHAFDSVTHTIFSLFSCLG